MDQSLNMIDLQYFTPHDIFQKVVEPSFDTEKKPSLHKSKEFIFYRKRILQLVKDLVKGTEKNEVLLRSFEHFTKDAIEHFKFTDKSDIIQNEFPIEKNVKQQYVVKVLHYHHYESEESLVISCYIKRKLRQLQSINDFIVKNHKRTMIVPTKEV